MAFFDLTDSMYNIGIVIEFYHLISKRSIKFKAFLTDFSDNYDSDWESQQVHGRMDPIETFKSTVRRINLGWTVVAASDEEAIQNMQKCGTLFAMLYPSYSEKDSAGSIQSPPLFKVKFMNLIANSQIDYQDAPMYTEQINNIFNKIFNLSDSELDKVTSNTLTTAKEAGILCRTKGFSYQPVIDDGMFIINGNVFPKTVKMSTELTILHQHPIGWGPDGEPLFITTHGFPYGLPFFKQDDKQINTTNKTSTTVVEEITDTIKNAILEGLLK